MTTSHRIEAFPALIYDTNKAGPMGDLIAPPYDLIDRAQQEALYARNPYNVIRLELNREPDPYASAATTLAQWRRDGVLIQTPSALFHYTQRFEVGRKLLNRSGIIARVKLEPFSSGRVLPHEKTFPKAKEDRLRLLTATVTNVSSIFGLYSSAQDDFRALMATIAARDPSLAATDDRGIVNEIRPISAPHELATIQRSLEQVQILIADGHHRYETALEYQRRRRAEEVNRATLHGYDFVMMTVVAFDDPGLVILPTHRVIEKIAPSVFATFAEKASKHFEVIEVASADALRDAVVDGGHGTIGVALKDQPLRLLKLSDATAMDVAEPDLPPAVRALDVARLHSLIIDAICGISADEVRHGGNISYTIDAAGALADVANGKANGAFLMNPPSVEDVARVSTSGATMPEKSTYFFPKLVTGMVMNPLEDQARRQ